MLPDFPTIKMKFRQALERHVDRRIRQEPLISQIRRERQFEGSRMSIGGGDEPRQTSGYKELVGLLEVPTAEIISKGPSAFYERVEDLASQLQEQQVRMMRADIERVVKETGNVVDAKGRPLTFEVFEESLDKVWMDFDEQGEPQLPTIFTTPELGLKLRTKMAEWFSNPQYKERYERLIERKKEEWNDREGNRKLVD